MPEKFDWQVEEEKGWEGPLTTTEASRWRVGWLILTVVMVLLTAGGLLLYRQVGMWADSVAAGVESDVRASHRLVRQAAAGADVELAMTVLSGRDPYWTSAQQQLIAEKLLFEPVSFGFDALPAAAGAELEEVVVELSPDLSMVELQFELLYSVEAEAGITETVTLRHTSVYRRGEERWLLSPPERDFWGEWLSYEGDRLMLIFPERDKEVAQRLAVDLEALLDDTCNLLGSTFCPEELQVLLRLDNHPDTLLETVEWQSNISSGLRLALPTPTLVGEPVDEAAYQALYRGYAVQLVSAVITELVDYSCCQHGLLYRALLEKQLSQLGLQPWPLQPGDYEQILQEALTQNSIQYLNVDLSPAAEENWQQVYALADFLAQTAPEEVAAIQHQLGQEMGYGGWRRLLSSQSGVARFDAQWQQFVYNHSASALQTPSIPLPEQGIQLVCEDTAGRTLYRYDPALADWQEVFKRSSSRFFDIFSLPAEDSYLISTFSQLILQRGEEEIVVSEQGRDDRREGTGGFHIEGFDPLGRYAEITAYTQGVGEVTYERWLLDLENCSQERCELQPVAGRLIWSPEGSQTLTMVAQQGRRVGVSALFDDWLYTLHRGDARGRSLVEVGSGGRPVWLNNESYSFIRLNRDGPDGSRELEVMIADADNKAGEVLLSGSMLLNALPEAGRPAKLFPLVVVAHPTEGNHLIVTAAESPQPAARLPGGPYYYFSVKFDADSWAVEAITLLFKNDERGNVSFSPDGRWLAIVIFYRSSIVYLFDLTTGTMTRTNFTGFGFDWSADGQWLLLNQDGAPLLVAPAYDYQLPVFHDFSGCGQAHFTSSHPLKGWSSQPGN